ncbi:hypothetical protein ABZ611_21865 [Streptomyces sp. NPDC007861]|uniref:hypothetical protein n=1 Tax=Streptomyces sp. NPDC007861 TaxID=3154893 RepID=UPI00340BF5EE
MAPRPSRGEEPPCPFAPSHFLDGLSRGIRRSGQDRSDGSQTCSVFAATGAESRRPDAVGTQIVSNAAVAFVPRANVVGSGDYKMAAGSRSDAFLFDFDGIKSLFDTSGKRNLTARQHSWTTASHDYHAAA